MRFHKNFDGIENGGFDRPCAQCIVGDSGPLRIVKDLHENLREDINKDLQGSSKNLSTDPHGSFNFSTRSPRIFKNPLRMFEDL